jgi:uncharacterized protein YegP (UPF0339 family)
VSGARAREIVDSTRREDGASFLCHRDQVYDEPTAICAGWWQTFANEDWILRLAVAMDIVVRLDSKGTTVDKVRVYQSDNGEWRWRRQSENGEVVAASTEGYSRKGGALTNLEQTQAGPYELIGGERDWVETVTPPSPEPLDTELGGES